MNRPTARLHRESLQRAAYYRWAAARGYALAGRDPLTGRLRDAMFSDRGESTAAYKAMARFWLERARQIRIGA
jgi:hypothetical protein